MKAETNCLSSIARSASPEREKPEVAAKTWRTEKTVTVTPVAKSPPKMAPQSVSRVTQEEVMTDTASRRSLMEKRNLFDKPSSPSSQRTPDPAMLPMSERRKLFEKNMTAPPKPIARFGESVTPAMLSK